MRRILVLMELAPALRRRLEAHCEVEVRPQGPLSDGELARWVPGFQGLLPLLTHRVGSMSLAAGKDLEIVANCAVGVDNVDLEEARRRGVVVTNTPGVLTDATADLTWALILALTRRLVPAQAFVREGRFAGWAPDLFVGRSLSAATLGVVGAGRIGKAVLERARAFGCRLLYTSRSPLSAEDERRLGVRRCSLEELLGEADVVSLHVPLMPGTRHLIDRDALARMNPGAFLINTSRGPVVDEVALAEALEEGRLGGAGLDVYEDEPWVHPGLLSSSRALLLPHIGSATQETRLRMAELCVESLEAKLVHGRRPALALVGA